MKDTWLGEPIVRESLHAVPREPVLLAASPKRASPEVGHCMPERTERPAVCRNCKVGEMPENDLPQPSPLFRDWMVHSAPQLLLNVQEFRPHAIAPRLPFELEGSTARFSADERKP
jgi:hypothetical protein